ncbi:hypothetical protein ACB092_04G160800 [Castanea dentata]
MVLKVLPLEKHLSIILLFIMATIVYIIAYLEIKSQRQDAAYLFIFRLICLVSRILSVELLVKLIISPVWLFMVNFCPILIIGVLRHWYQEFTRVSMTQMIWYSRQYISYITRFMDYFIGCLGGSYRYPN